MSKLSTSELVAQFLGLRGAADSLDYARGARGGRCPHHRRNQAIFAVPKTCYLVAAMSVLPRPLSHSSNTRPWTGHSTARPYTAQTRPGTARPQTATSLKHDSSYVLAVVEGRGIGREVGMAALDKDTGRVDLVQVTIIRELNNNHLINYFLAR